MLIRRAEVAGRGIVDVRTDGAVVAAIGAAGTLDGGAARGVLDAAGGALLPGLHDHHIHLRALSAALDSVHCGPPAVRDPHALRRALAAAPVRPDGWVRGVAYHESVAGMLDRRALDALRGDVPLRVQHRSGALWILSSAALARVGLAGRLPEATPQGVERDEAGRATGRCYRADDWLRARWGSDAAPDLSTVGRRLARHGVTGVTDATPTNDGADIAAFGHAIASGALRQDVRVMGGAALAREHDHPAGVHPEGVHAGERKLVLDESRLPTLDALRGAIEEAHASDRSVAIHCVTRAELAFALAALGDAGRRRGDRIEHAAVAPPELALRVAELGLRVVTQPNFVRERGDAYATDVDAIDRPWLYRCRGWLDAGVPLGGGTDAPFGNADPWRAMRAAVDRTTSRGRRIGEREALPADRARDLFTTPADDPGGAPRRVEPGARADLCLLAVPWATARERLSSTDVVATIRAGRVTWSAAEAGRGDRPG